MHKLDFEVFIDSLFAPKVFIALTLIFTTI